jgi:hypothetical protein
MHYLVDETRENRRDALAQVDGVELYPTVEHRFEAQMQPDGLEVEQEVGNVLLDPHISPQVEVLANAELSFVEFLFYEASNTGE